MHVVLTSATTWQFRDVKENLSNKLQKMLSKFRVYLELNEKLKDLVIKK